MIIAGHTGIGEVGRAAGQDAFIGGLYMGMGAGAGGDQAVEVEAHGHFLGGGRSGGCRVGRAAVI